jgi:hypothetical protein
MQNNTIRQSNYEKIVETVMVINFTNINNTNNPIAFITELNEHTKNQTTTYHVGDPNKADHKNVAGLHGL